MRISACAHASEIPALTDPAYPEWYRQRLSRGFTQAGAGLWVRKGSTVVLHELERHR